MFYKDWSATIYCDGEPAEEYKFCIESDDTASCYIASEAGKKFEVHWKNELEGLASADCYMDGRCVGCATTKPGKKGRRLGCRTGAESRQPFQFAALQLTDNEDLANPDDLSVGAIGIIELRVHRVRYSRKSKREGYRAKDAPACGLVHERSKKAGAHCVSFGERIKCPPIRAIPVIRYLDKKNKPYVRFIFRYKSREMLQAEEIIPPDAVSQYRIRPDLSARDYFAELARARDQAAANSSIAGPSKLHGRPMRVKREAREDTMVVDSEYEQAEVESLLSAGSLAKKVVRNTSVKPGSSSRRPVYIDVDADFIDLTIDSD
ncbi:uncharacterized protein LAESUDRAFT_731445 [Laetiporus sulphureus 93-53]|uniref:DUF7918 domain-containing protein n=1 Tax=Laetiporus sulphureus 93-53 TaxID=1314785 RepID=A0A165BKJ7_9APHY|nr:uncharacterized protein LAESUDRAFT_731445 [Laetiporus sulphureus 93-53]KZT01225.1 hypothetical protein LAESUDRAFT_731445 [Laetiporus sulphureus 93-53]